MSGIDVDPDALNGAGVAVSDGGDTLAEALAALQSGLASSDAMSGHDAAGMVFAQSYTRNGQALLDAATAGINALRNTGFGISMSATNYSRAEAASTPGGGQPLSAPAEPSELDSPAMPRPYGDGIAEPFLWSVVQRFVGDFWPDGDPGRLRAAADAWRGFGTTLSGMADLPGVRSGITAQEMPEATAMLDSVDAISVNLAALAEQAHTTARQLDGFAAEIDAAQNAIRDLLDQLSPSGLVDTVGGLLSGENPWDEIRRVADAITAIQQNMKRQADADDAVFQQGMATIDGLITSGMDATRKQFVDWMGEDVGGVAAFAFNAPADFHYGAIKTAVQGLHGLEGLSPRHLVSDPGGYLNKVAGAVDGAANFVPPLLVTKLIANTDHTVDQLKDLVHYDDLTSGHPLRGVGGIAFDIGSAAVPMGAAARPGAIAASEARGATAAAGTESRTAGSTLSDAATSSTRAAGGDVAASASRIADSLDSIKLPDTPAAIPRAEPGPSVLPETRAPVDQPPRADSPSGPAELERQAHPPGSGATTVEPPKAGEAPEAPPQSSASQHPAGSASPFEIEPGRDHGPGAGPEPRLPPPDDGLTHIDIDSGGTGAWNYELNHPAPNTHYTVDNRFEYTTDRLGRSTEMEATLSIDNPADRNTYQQGIAGGADRLPGDHGGHIFGSQFGGPGEAINLTAMRDTLNAIGPRDYYVLESEWKSLLQQGHTVEVKVDIDYPGDSRRPDFYAVKTYVDGNLYHTRDFEN